MTALLQATRFEAGYGEAPIIRSLSFAIGNDEIVALLGRNGMGKTTLMRGLIGLTPLRQGALQFAGDDIAAAAPETIARAGIAYVPAGREIFGALSVRENLVMCARPGAAGGNGWTFERVLALFPRLAERLRHGGHQLSGGEQQMLAIGRALMTNPRLLILDEATEGLAPLIRAEIWRCLASLKELGLSILVIDKNVGALMKVADRHFLIERGRVVWKGSSQELAAAPDVQHRYLGV